MAGMLKYMDVIRDLARNNGDWKGYDKKFRKIKMQQKLGWGMSHQEMYFRALCGVEESYDVASISSVNSMKLSNVNVPTGYCVRYHTGKPRLIPCKTVIAVTYATNFILQHSVGMQGVPFQVLKCK